MDERLAAHSTAAGPAAEDLTEQLSAPSCSAARSSIKARIISAAEPLSMHALTSFLSESMCDAEEKEEVAIGATAPLEPADPADIDVAQRTKDIPVAWQFSTVSPTSPYYSSCRHPWSWCEATI